MLKETVITFVYTYSTDDKAALNQLMSWLRIGAGATAVAMMTLTGDAIWRRYEISK